MTHSKNNEIGYPANWCWPAFFFTLFWQGYKHHWVKLILYFGIFNVIDFIIGLFNPNLFIISWLCFSIYLGLFGRYDDYLLKIKNEPLWPWFPYTKNKIITWVFICLSLPLPLIGMGRSLSNFEFPAYSLKNTSSVNFDLHWKNVANIRFGLPSGWNLVRPRSKNDWILIQTIDREKVVLGPFENKIFTTPELSTQQMAILILEKMFKNTKLEEEALVCVEKSSSTKIPWHLCEYYADENHLQYRILFTSINDCILTVRFLVFKRGRIEPFQKDLQSFLDSIQILSP